MSQTPTMAQLYGRVGGLRLRATHDPKEYTAAGRRAFLKRFEREVDPDGVLPAEEREVRAEAARKAHMTLLAARSAQARARRDREERHDVERVSALERRIAALEGSRTAELTDAPQ